MLWHGRHLLVSTLRKVRWEADQTDEVLGVADVQIPAIVAVHGSSVPWGRVDTDGVTVVPARRVPDLLRGLPPILGPQRVAWLADRARLRFAPLHIQVGGASFEGATALGGPLAALVVFAVAALADPLDLEAVHGQLLPFPGGAVSSLAAASLMAV